MTHTVLVAGTASHVGKSTVAAGLCRLLADRGVDVAPYKAQNMSNNARAVPNPRDGDAYGEIGISQYVQARAARVPATTDMNPVLLKPRGDGESQLVIQGEAVGHFSSGAYYEEHWERARRGAVASWERLAADHKVVVAEGAGSVAEINLHDRDLANVETARFADRGGPDGRRDDRAPVSGVDILLVVDIERGGAFASLVGTLELMPADLRERVVGAVVTKFRGDRTLLDPGIEAFEDRTGVPVLGVLPYDDPGLPEEDSVSLPPEGERSVSGRDDELPEQRAVTVAVPRFPRVSNFTDLEPLAREPGVRVAYVPLDAPLDADAVVLPGTKNTVDDLLACRDAGLGERLAAFDGPVVGLCGGYQMLGERITNAGIESTDDRPADGSGEADGQPTDGSGEADGQPADGSGEADGQPADGTVEGFGLLPVETRFSTDKRVEAVTRELRGTGPLAGATGAVSGYEIHMGDTRLTGAAERPFPAGGAAVGRVLGTYLHGLFENRLAREAFLDATFAAAGLERPGTTAGAESPYDRAATLLETHLDCSFLPE